MNTPLRPRGLNASLAVLVAAALTFAGLAKVFSPEDLGLLRLLGDARRDPPWFSQVLAAIELATAVALLVFRRVGVVAAVVLTSGFVCYHVVLGLGFGAPT
ncbi:MAG: DoxX family protein [Planctomycetes bacterium]|nr:DoxX family protein [Planctomycetota bacterium]MCB9830596.1 DoxX family protein [Planctomycetota bacterium]